ncbi:MAG: hypothetical protein K6G90_03035 [Clostridia bacterium]|nr:hypothetical protein [Clostridia bacterium]
MFYEKEWPVLEFDDSPTAKLNPSHYAGDGFDTDKMVITFFPAVIEKIADELQKREVSFIRGLCWTTDAIFRETADRIERRKSEGAKIVEMEQAGCIAVARFRGFDYGALIYGGDDLSGEEWDGRKWRSREGVRYDLVGLCAELVGLI